MSVSFDPTDSPALGEPTPQQYRFMSPPEQDKIFRDALWMAMLTILRVYGRRYGYCENIEIKKVVK